MRPIPLAKVLLSTLSLVFSPIVQAQFVQQGGKLVQPWVTTSHGQRPGQGTSVSLSSDGNTALVGAPQEYYSFGLVYVYTRTNGAWGKQTGITLTPIDGADEAQLGRSVALSYDGNTALLGGPYDDMGPSGASGGTWVLIRANNTWTLQGPELWGTETGSTPPGQGWSVALSADGNTAIIGGPSDNASAGTGAAWVFTRTNGVWTQQGHKLVGTGGVGRQGQGMSVSLSADGNTAIIGGPSDNANVGAAWVFTRSNGVWTQQGGKLVGTGGVGEQRMGASVALSADGSTAILGGNVDNGNVGATWVFTRSNGVWTQQGGKLVGTGGVGQQSQGASVSLSADGNTVIIGGYADNGNIGAAWVFTRTNGVWTQQGDKLVGTDGVGQQRQGTSVSLSADGYTAMVGGPGDSTSIGAAWVFVRATTPYYGTPHQIPGTIQAEDFDYGAEGASYHDSDPSNKGGLYRSSAVDIGQVWVDELSQSVGWTRAGEWLAYKVNVRATGNYTVQARVASGGVGGYFHIEVDGVDKTGPWQIPNTGGWDTWQTLSKSSTPLTEGQHVLRLVFDSDGPTGEVGNVNYIRIVGSDAQLPYPGTPHAIPGTVQAEDFDRGGEGISYEDRESVNREGRYREENIDIEICSEGGYNVAWTKPLEWMEYTVNVGYSGVYRLEASVACLDTGGTFSVAFGGVVKTGLMRIPATGGFQTWRTISSPTFSLSAGEQVMRIAMVDTGKLGSIGNINHIRLTTTSGVAEGPGQLPLPSSVVLEQNFPNPFNPSTSIMYGLPVRTEVTISLHNVVGERIRDLVHVAQDAGWHILEVDCTQLASGVYFYRLSTGSGIVSRRMILIK